jgi:hypothetical protein
MINIFSLSIYPREFNVPTYIEKVRDKTIGVIFIDDDDEIREKKNEKRTTHLDIVKRMIVDQYYRLEFRYESNRILFHGNFLLHYLICLLSMLSLSLLILIFDIRPYKPDSKAFFVRKSRRSDNAQTR